MPSGILKSLRLWTLLLSWPVAHPGLFLTFLALAHLGSSYLWQVALPTWAGPVGQRRSAQGAQVAARAGAEGWQCLQEGTSGLCGIPTMSPLQARRRDSHDMEELVPSSRNMVGSGRGLAGEGSGQREGAWKRTVGSVLVAPKPISRLAPKPLFSTEMPRTCRMHQQVPSVHVHSFTKISTTPCVGKATL